MECILIIAHAMGRILVVPPYQRLYLLNKKKSEIRKNAIKTNQRKLEEKEDDQLGFEDFFDVNILRQQKGLKVMPMQEFLQKEGITGHLRGIYPPGNKTDIWGTQVLWPYLDESADVTPEWSSKSIVMPLTASHYEFDNLNSYPQEVKKRLEKFVLKRGGMKSIVYYNETLRNASHIHIPGDGEHRLLTHHYG